LLKIRRKWAKLDLSQSVVGSNARTANFKLHHYQVAPPTVPNRLLAFRSAAASNGSRYPQTFLEIPNKFVSGYLAEASDNPICMMAC